MHLKFALGVILIQYFFPCHAFMDPPDDEQHMAFAQAQPPLLTSNAELFNSDIVVITQSSDLKETKSSARINYTSLPQEIWDHIISYMNCRNSNLHQVNHYFFRLITNYPTVAIAQRGFKYQLNLSRSSQSKIQGIELDFSEFSEKNSLLENIPNYVWYSCVTKVSNLPRELWPDLKNTRIHELNLNSNKISASDISYLALALKESQICILSLLANNLGDDGAHALGQALQGTSVNNVNIMINSVGDEGALAFAKALHKTSVHTIDISFNNLSEDGAFAFAQALCKTLARNVNIDLSLYKNLVGHHFFNLKSEEIRFI